MEVRYERAIEDHSDKSYESIIKTKKAKGAGNKLGFVQAILDFEGTIEKSAVARQSPFH
jgi:hypothetical protein